MTTSLTGTQQE